MARTKVSLIQDFREIYDSRNILRSLVVKNLYGKYKNSILGFAWNFIMPLIILLMYFIIFSEIRSNNGIEDAGIFISSALFLFTFLTHCITGGTGAFTGNSGMIKKMYLPKEILVLADVISAMIVCIIGYAVVLIIMLAMSYDLKLSCVLLLPIVLMTAFIFGLGTVFFLSSLTVYVRDIQYALGPLGIALFIMTPMRYMAADASGLLGVLIWYNPLTYYVETVHDLLYFGQIPSAFNFSMCIILALISITLGYTVFRKLRSGFVKRL